VKQRARAEEAAGGGSELVSSIVREVHGGQRVCCRGLLDYAQEAQEAQETQSFPHERPRRPRVLQQDAQRFARPVADPETNAVGRENAGAGGRHAVALVWFGGGRRSLETFDQAANRVADRGKLRRCKVRGAAAAAASAGCGQISAIGGLC
jgi:hypothetical protein